MSRDLVIYLSASSVVCDNEEVVGIFDPDQHTSELPTTGDERFTRFGTSGNDGNGHEC